MRLMAKSLEQALEAAHGLPANMQDDLADMILHFVGDDRPVVAISANEAASFDESFAQAARVELAIDEQVRAIWAKHGL